MATVSAVKTSYSVDVHAKARFHMVESQLRTNRVTDERLLEQLGELPRQIFVPAALASVAYVDKSLKIAPGRYLLEPLALARLLQEAVPQPDDKVLVVGAGTGYSAALLANLTASVVALESDEALASKARANIGVLGVRNATVVTGPLDAGWAEQAPYDLILIDGMIDILPERITAQLAEHGRLVTLKAGERRCGAGWLFYKRRGAVSGRVLFDATSSVLPGFELQPAFEL